MTSSLTLVSLAAMPPKNAAANREQLGIRVDKDLVVEAKVLAARQRRRLNEVVEEALRDLLGPCSCQSTWLYAALYSPSTHTSPSQAVLVA